jgi:hypothetical protein
VLVNLHCIRRIPSRDELLTITPVRKSRAGRRQRRRRPIALVRLVSYRPTASIGTAHEFCDVAAGLFEDGKGRGAAIVLSMKRVGPQSFSVAVMGGRANEPGP